MRNGGQKERVMQAAARLVTRQQHVRTEKINKKNYRKVDHMNWRLSCAACAPYYYPLSLCKAPHSALLLMASWQLNLMLLAAAADTTCLLLLRCIPHYACIMICPTCDAVGGGQ